MPQGLMIFAWLGLAALAANLPWLSERWFLIIARHSQRAKPFWARLIEWSLLYILIIGIGFGFEYKLTGVMQAQGWEFYVVTLSLFAVAALPGFIYRYQLQKLLERVYIAPASE